MESSPQEQIASIDDANKIIDAEKQGKSSEKGGIPEENTEVSANQEEVEADDQIFFDATDQEEAKVQVEKSGPKVDEMGVDDTTNLKKIDSPSKQGPEEKVLITQINDYSDFSMIDKLDKDTYITDEFRNYQPSD